MHVVRRGAVHSTQCSLMGLSICCTPTITRITKLLAGRPMRGFSSMGHSVDRDRAWVDGRMRSSECFKGLLHVDSMQSLRAVLRHMRILGSHPFFSCIQTQKKC